MFFHHFVRVPPFYKMFSLHAPMLRIINFTQLLHCTLEDSQKNRIKCLWRKKKIEMVCLFWDMLLYFSKIKKSLLQWLHDVEYRIVVGKHFTTLSYDDE